MQQQTETTPAIWFLVAGDNQDSPLRLVYKTEDHAEAVAFTNRIEYPNLGPWRVIPLQVSA